MTPDELKRFRELLRNDKALFNRSLELIIKSAFVEKFLKGDERPCDQNDFLKTRMKREKIISDIQILIDDFSTYICNKNQSTFIENELLSLILILCGQNVILHPWNTEETVKNCKIILFKILKLVNCKDISELMSKNHKINLVKVLFQILCADLTVSLWKYFPASVACYKWVLKMIKQPDVSLHLQFILPPALLLVDDFINDNRIIGAGCLNHIIQNITVADLQLHGYGDVIYSALIPLLRVREAELICSIVPPLISVATKLEFDLGNRHHTKWSKFDEILEIFLENMELEQLIDLRYCYISNLCPLINAAGYGIIRWSNRILRIFQEYIQAAWKYNDEKTINLSIKAMEKYIKFSSKVISVNAKNLLLILAVVLSRSNSTGIAQNENKERTIKCIKLLLKLLPQTEKKKLEMFFQRKFFLYVNLNTEVQYNVKQ